MAWRASCLIWRNRRRANRQICALQPGAMCKGADCGELRRIIVLLARAGGEPIRGDAKLHGMMFLLSYPLKLGRGHYERRASGPYSRAVEAEAKSLQDAGALRMDDGNLSLTEEGAAEAVRAGPRTLDVLLEYKETFNDMSDDELLAYVCAAHPDAAGPAACGRLRARMEGLVMSMLRKEKISCGRAAELLGEEYWSVLKKAGEAGIRPLGA